MCRAQPPRAINEHRQCNAHLLPYPWDVVLAALSVRWEGERDVIVSSNALEELLALPSNHGGGVLTYGLEEEEEEEEEEGDGNRRREAC